MKMLKIQSLVSMITLVATVLCFAACREQDNEKVDPVLELELADNWKPIEFSFDSSATITKYYNICDDKADYLYNDQKYTEVLNLISQHFSLNADKTCILTPVCSSNSESVYTWSVVTVSNGSEIKLMQAGKEIRFLIKSRGGDDLILFPKGYGFEEPNFNLVLKRDI